jgi:hypothetical protein
LPLLTAAFVYNVVSYSLLSVALLPVAIIDSVAFGLLSVACYLLSVYVFLSGQLTTSDFSLVCIEGPLLEGAGLS